MRTLAIGDIHGCLRALDGLLGMLRVQPADTLVVLGDYADRGPDSRGVIERMLSLQEQCRLVCLRGNHDEMRLAARADMTALRAWLPFGGRQTLESYAPAGSPGQFDDVPDRHWQFLEATLPYHETDTHIFVHGCLD